MLKYLYKTFLIATISASLVMVQTNVVMAASNTVIHTDATTGDISTKTKYEFDKISNSDMIASIAMLAGGFIATRMVISYRPITTDVMIAGAAGVAFIAGEVLSNMKFKGSIDNTTLEIETKNDKVFNEEQAQRLRDLKKSYEKARSATKTKKTLQTVAAAAFGAAALTATYYAMNEDAAVGMCRGVMTTSQTLLGTCAKSGVAGNMEAAICGTCLAKIGAYQAAYEKYSVSRVIPTQSEVKQKTLSVDEKFLADPTRYCADPGVSTPTVKSIALKMASSCGKSLGVLIANETSANLKELSVTNMSLEKLQTKKISFFEKGLNLFFPTAEAGWLPLLGMAASTIAAFTLVTGTMAMEIDSLMFVPRNRAIAFGLFAGLAFMAAKSSGNVLETIDRNIRKIDEILAELEKQGKGVKAQNIQKQNITNTSGIGNISFATAGINEVTPCATSDSTSNSTSNCKSLSSQVSTSAGFSSLPPALQELATEAVGVADGVSGKSTISGATLSAAESFGNKQGAIRKLLNKTQDNFLKGSNVSAAQSQDNLLKSLGAKITSNLDKKGLTAGGFMASIGSTPINSNATGNKEVKDELLNRPTADIANAIDIGVGGAGLKLDFEEEPVGDLMAAAGNGAVPEYDLNINEIGKEDGPSLFEVISNRYLRSGYPKLLEVESAPAQKK